MCAFVTSALCFTLAATPARPRYPALVYRGCTIFVSVLALALAWPALVFRVLARGMRLTLVYIPDVPTFPPVQSLPPCSRSLVVIGTILPKQAARCQLAVLAQRVARIDAQIQVRLPKRIDFFVVVQSRFFSVCLFQLFSSIFLPC